MGKQNHYDYFISFEKIAAKGSEIARMLIRSFEEFQQETLPDHLAAMHQLEHEADLMGHEMMHHLARDFITPIERDDLIQLANELDEVIDAIEDVLMRVYMYNVPSILPDAEEKGWNTKRAPLRCKACLLLPLAGSLQSADR